jgi:putative ABC transport system ATP-binding protein
VIVAGHELGALDENGLARLRRDHVGIVFQSFHLLPTMTALENVAIPLELAGGSDALARADAALRQVGLAQRVAHYPAQLSGGEQQRVAIARALVAAPGLVLADEPTGNLDGATGRIVIDCLFEERARLGSALLLITHDAGLAERCDRQVRMQDGRLTAG